MQNEKSVERCLDTQGAVPIPLSAGEGPSRVEIRVAKLNVEVDLTLQLLLQESEEIEIARQTKNFHRCLPFNGKEVAQMVG